MTFHVNEGSKPKVVLRQVEKDLRGKDVVVEATEKPEDYYEPQECGRVDGTNESEQVIPLDLSPGTYLLEGILEDAETGERTFFFPQARQEIEVVVHDRRFNNNQ